MSTIAMKKININIPFDLLKEVERRAKEHNFTRSKLIREFLSAYLNELKKRELREKLKEGYLANANRDQQITEEFAYSDHEPVAKADRLKFGSIVNNAKKHTNQKIKPNDI